MRRTVPATGQVLLDVRRFELAAGERVGVGGPSGSGKTLLLRALAWLDPLDRGEICYCGRTVHHDEVPRYRRQIAYLHQKPALDGTTVEAALQRPFRLSIHRHARYDRQAAVDRLVQLGRDADFLQKKNQDLSGGETQIAALVRVLLVAPEVLLLDEPTAALDPATARRVESLVAGWVTEAEDRRAVIWVSHNAAQTGRLASRTVRMRSGRLDCESGDGITAEALPE